MIRDGHVDVVTIAVKVPAHRELVLAALGAGKAVYCEAPLGRTVAETEEMARAAGSLHTARIVATTVVFGPQMPCTHDYFNDPSSGANLLTITAGHTLDVVETVLGAIVEVDARAEILY
jgi:predicted dehydrogenase